MFIPKNMLMPNDQLWSFMRAHSFGMLVSRDLTATHLPFIFDEAEKAVFAHMAKANQQWRELDGQEVMVIFAGPHSYISPRWYSSAPNVPTWNYAAAHMYGTLKLVTDDINLAIMKQLVEVYDPGLTADKTIMDDEYVDKLQKATVGFRIDVTRIEAKEKLNQHKKAEDQAGVFAALQEATDYNARALAAYMEKRRLGTGEE